MSRKMSRRTSSMHRTSSARKWVSLRRMGSSAYSGEALYTKNLVLELFACAMCAANWLAVSTGQHHIVRWRVMCCCVLTVPMKASCVSMRILLQVGVAAANGSSDY
jgi:hypothetical protein